MSDGERTMEPMIEFPLDLPDVRVLGTRMNRSCAPMPLMA